ncbi:Hypothetical protein, putative [Bodo saltans]|uniref:Uncharacterized protein n=1 Tax=Bodo saltans TaxID=75058 RepID=A0A0S4IRW4_BODSA|nr:Hypothetical protein, putative [Bodo saltans]|eukprot:CUE89199.1 Hypothetical protein, putative [Bodo saltans]
MFARNTLLRISQQGSGFWAPSGRQMRSLGEKGSNMRAVSQRRFRGRHAAFKQQQVINLENRDRQVHLQSVQKQLQKMASVSISSAGSAGSGHHNVIQKKEDRMASARELLQLGEHLRKERKREFNGSFVRSQMGAYRRR